MHFYGLEMFYTSCLSALKCQNFELTKRREYYALNALKLWNWEIEIAQIFSLNCSIYDFLLNCSIPP